MSAVSETGGEGKGETHRRIVRRLEEQARDVERLTRGLGEDALAKRTVPEKWGLKELVAHVWRVQQVFEVRLDLMLSEDDPALPPYSPDGDVAFDALVARPGAEVVSGFLEARGRLVARLSSLGPGDWHRRGRHPEYTDYDVHFMMEYLGHHEAHHLYQLYQRRSPLGKIPH